MVLLSGGADEKAAPASAPSSEQPTATPTPVGTPEQVLRSLINLRALGDCSTKNPTDSQWADAELACSGVDGIPVSAYHFPSQSAADRQIGSLAAHFTDTGNCDDGQPSIEAWSTPQEPAGGTRLCYFYADNFVIYWFYSEERIAFAAQDPSPARLTAWWSSFDPVNH